jgi:asparagine synthetase B (glutamine-hydrolysing)
MSGIAGIVYLDRNRSVAVNDLNRMCRILVAPCSAFKALHRGPDDEGFIVKGNVGLGMRGLKVIDLVTGYQPISNEDGSIWIVFNGEIYNYPVDLVSDLIRHLDEPLADVSIFLIYLLSKLASEHVTVVKMAKLSLAT